MASYTEDAMRAKLSSLNETQESIVTVAQWMLFHKRHAESAAQLWFQRLQTAQPGKRLNFLYIANEVVQQSKARKRTEYLNAFSPIISDAIAVAYKGAPNDIKQKLRRVVEVWRDRQVFDQAIQQRVEASLEELDKSGSTKKGTLGGSLFSSGGDSAPKELQPLVALQNDVTKAEITANPAVSNATAEHERITAPNATFSNNNLHAAQLAQVLKSLSNAEGAVAKSISTRQALIDGLEKLLKSNQDALTIEEARRSDILQKRAQIEEQRSAVELAIMRGISPAGEPSSTLDAPEPPRPEVEGLTPPPMIESLTPPGEPLAAAFITTTGADVIEEQPLNQDEPPPQDPRVLAMTDPLAAIQVSNGDGRHEELRGPSPKKRKIGSTNEDEMAAFLGDGGAMDGIDPAVAEMLGSDG